MKMEISYSQDLPASEQGIDYAIKNLPGVGDSFIIMIDEDNKGFYMQVSGGQGSYQVEYRDGETGKQYSATNNLSEEDVIIMFHSYWKHTDEYKKVYSWEVLDLSSQKKGCFMIFVAGAVIGGATLLCC